MRKYVYKNATVYITEPTEAHLNNIRKATERFANKLVKEGLIGHVQGRNNHRTGRASSNARERDKQIKKEDYED